MRTKPFIEKDEIIDDYLQDEMFRQADEYEKELFIIRRVRNYRRRKKPRVKTQVYIPKYKKLPF